MKVKVLWFRSFNPEETRDELICIFTDKSNDEVNEFVEKWLKNVKKNWKDGFIEVDEETVDDLSKMKRFK